MPILDWFNSVDWLALLERAGLPIVAILASTGVAIWLARRERRDALADRRKERRLEAGAGVLVALAPLTSFSDLDEPMQAHLWEIRARIAVYRAWIDADDRSGDWLALRHREGMLLWNRTLAAVSREGGMSRITVDALLAALAPAQAQMHLTTEMFTQWLSGHMEIDELLRDGARILKAHPAPEGEDWSGARMTR